MNKTITLKYVNPPKPGKTAWNCKDTNDVFYLIDKKVDAASIPKDIPIEVECGTWTPPDGETISILKSWKNAPQEVVAKAKVTWDQNNNVAGMTRVIADAIRAGLIKDPSDMLIWALEYRTVVAAFNDLTRRSPVKNVLPDTPPEYPEPTGSLQEVPDWVK